MSFTSDLEEIIMFERFDKRKLKYIIYNEAKFRKLLEQESFGDIYDPLRLAKTIYSRSNGNVLKSSYRFAEGKKSGRRFARFSMQMLSKKIKHTISSSFYNDLDIVNCHPSILLHICEKYNFEFPELKSYVNERKDFLSKHLITKTDVLKIINGGTKISLPSERWSNSVKSLFNGTKLITELICEKFRERYEEHSEILASRKKIWNHKGSFLNHILTEYEDKILLCLSNKVFKGDSKEGVLCFDGLMIPKEYMINIEELENEVLETVNIKIKLKLKPMNQGFDISEEMLKDVDDKPDVYNFSYFMNKIDTVETEEDFRKIKREVIDWMNDNYCHISEQKSFIFRVRPGEKCPYTGFVERDYLTTTFNNLSMADFANKILKASIIQTKGDEKKKITKIISPCHVWNTSPLRNEYDGIEFNPRRFYEEKKNSSFTKSLKYNKFYGLAIEKEEAIRHEKLSEDSPFLQHIFKRWSKCNKEVYDYVLDWFAHCVQRPGIKMRSALVIKSAERSGKGIIVQIMAEIIGKTYFFQPTDVSDVLGNFNSDMEAKLLLFLDEMVWGGDKEKAGSLKKLVTESSGTLKVKYMSNRKIKQLFNLVVASNEDWVIPVGSTSTRWMIMQMNDELALMEEKEKKEIIRQIANVDRFQLARFLHERDISSFDPTKNPRTEALREQKILSLSRVKKWWYTQIYSNSLRFGKPISKKEIFDKYIEESNDKHISLPVFFRRMYEMTGELKIKRMKNSEGKRERLIVLPTLTECRNKWKYLMADKGWNFPEEDESDSDSDSDIDMS